MFRLLCCAGLFLFCSLLLSAQNVWLVSEKEREIRLDGWLNEWEGVAPLVLQAGRPGVRVEGQFSGEEDLRVELRALWDRRFLWISLLWRDDRWDVTRVGRDIAIWVTPDRRRRQRMLFYDYWNLEIYAKEHQYTLWLAPRIEDQGPFLWHRQIERRKGMDLASSPPLVTARQEGELASLELQFSWEELRLRPKEKLRFPVSLLFADSDWPGEVLESKLGKLKSLGWSGEIQLIGSPK